MITAVQLSLLDGQTRGVFEWPPTHGTCCKWADTFIYFSILDVNCQSLYLGLIIVLA
jgi:hypothetical protein